VSPVFVDTVGVLALQERSDQWHEAAARAWTDLLLQDRLLVTTSLIFLECGNAAARKPYRARIDEIRREFIADGSLIQPTEADIEEAWRALVRSEAGQAGIVDHVSFVVMRRLGLTQAFTNDAHFRAAGFETLF